MGEREWRKGMRMRTRPFNYQQKNFNDWNKSTREMAYRRDWKNNKNESNKDIHRLELIWNPQVIKARGKNLNLKKERVKEGLEKEDRHAFEQNFMSVI
jgi:hypothetical protein